MLGTRTRGHTQVRVLIGEHTQVQGLRDIHTTQVQGQGGGHTQVQGRGDTHKYKNGVDIHRYKDGGTYTGQRTGWGHSQMQRQEDTHMCKVREGGTLCYLYFRLMSGADGSCCLGTYTFVYTKLVQCTVLCTLD